ncbi:hypothetical protein ZRA01_18060 [Zoogloea ramigera]|uniref:Uncharacterized protein n=1 Tax=Zoogloea ramigera TaxID=350 RepID=A0A4Y4CWT6_ZOORA|nr:E2 domain-associated cysteine-rich protein [Zoogloea ramigera]GEC95733.1 hypothetical protein ZRA01_18060 [Zoogloea ramigera]
MTTAVDLIALAAPDFGGALTRSPDTSAILDLPVKLVDGRIIPYKLLLKQKGDRVTAQEETPQHLPPFCPERHINPDGTFCLYFTGTTCLNVIDEESARAWLETVYRYLKLQERVRLKRRWPNNDTWAHGDAAYHQRQAQAAATAINDRMLSALTDGRLQLKFKRSKGRPILDLWIDSTHIYSVWELDKRVINQKQRCFCGMSGLKVAKRVRRCADHAKRASELVLALRDWEDAEELYWRAMQGKSCCGTCDSCPLRR